VRECTPSDGNPAGCVDTRESVVQPKTKTTRAKRTSKSQREELERLTRASALDADGRVQHGVRRGVAYDDAREVDAGPMSGKRARKRSEHVPAGLRPVKLGRDQLAHVDLHTVSARIDHSADPALLYAAQRIERALRGLRTTGRGPVTLAPAIVAAYASAFGWPLSHAWAEPFFARLQYAKQAEHDPSLSHPEIIHDTTPAAILRDTAADCSAMGVPLPEWIADPALIAWLLARYSPGRGGGRSRKLSDATIRGALLDGRTLLALLVADEKRMRAKKSSAGGKIEFLLMVARLRASLTT
jgi:hypothetical protein